MMLMCDTLPQPPRAATKRLCRPRRKVVTEHNIFQLDAHRCGCRKCILGGYGKERHCLQVQIGGVPCCQVRDTIGILQGRKMLRGVSLCQ